MGLMGYARVSITEDRQVLDRQIDALNQAGCERIFEDRASGAKAERPGLAACLDHLRKGDVLVVLDLDLDLDRLASELILKAARARSRKGGRPRIMTADKLRYARHLMSDRERTIPSICQELGDLPASTLYQYVHADGALKEPGRRLLQA